MLKNKKIIIVIGILIFLMVFMFACKSKEGTDGDSKIDIADEQIELKDIIDEEEEENLSEKESESKKDDNASNSSGNQSGGDIVIDNNVQDTEHDENVKDENGETQESEKETWSSLF